MVRKVFQACTGFLASTILPQLALAQTPAVAPAEESSWLVWAVFLGAAVVICATGFMNPKRSHLS